VVFYITLFFLFVIQEPISSGVFILEAYQLGYNLLIVHAPFILATLLDITLGYFIGSYIEKHFHSGKIVTYLISKTQAASAILGKYGEYLFLFVWGPMIFPWSTLIAPWLRIPFWKTFVLLFLGDLILWYGGQWLLVLGVKTFIPDPLLALYALVLVALLVTVGMKYLLKQKLS
jgi:membrane protein YqaA with SNARE-associated domain